MYSRRLYSRRSLHLRRREAYGIVGALPLGAKGCVAVAQGAKAVVWRLLKMKGRQYDKTHLVSWWAVFPKGPAAARQRGIWPCANARAKGCGR